MPSVTSLSVWISVSHEVLLERYVSAPQRSAVWSWCRDDASKNKTTREEGYSRLTPVTFRIASSVSVPMISRG